MSAKILDGKALAARIKNDVREEIVGLEELGITPGLAVIIVGDDPASRTYVNGKKKDCEECGICSEEFALPADVTQDELISLIDQLNKRPDIDGILVQRPLPEHINVNEVLSAIDPSKDVDVFHPVNVGKVVIGSFELLPCTPAGIISLLDEYGIEPEGKNCVILGRSDLVGKPLALLLLHKNATVTICHSKTKKLGSITKSADILISAVGSRGLVTADMVKAGVVVIDVAMNRDEEGELCGDVCYDEVAAKASYITPVPGGVGPMTRAILMQNTLKAAKLHNNINN